MRDLLWRLGGAALLFGGPVLLLIAIALGLVAWVFHVRAPWFLWVCGICAVAGALLLTYAVDYFRGLSHL